MIDRRNRDNGQRKSFMNQPPAKPTFTRAPRPANAVSTAHPSATGATTVRLNKRMAELGLCSRREADALD
jgi:23S rRNA pseudouridine2604 synthase